MSRSDFYVFICYGNWGVFHRQTGKQFAGWFESETAANAFIAKICEWK